MKKFKDMGIGRFLLGSPMVKMAVKSIPVVGDIISPILDDTTRTKRETKGGLTRTEHIEGSEPGQITKEELLPILIRWGILVGLIIYALISGDWEGAEKGKDLFTS